MQLIDGRKIRNTILATLKDRIAALPHTPLFCDVLVGNDPASAQYVSMKERTAENIGIYTHHAAFPDTITTDELVAEIKKISEIQYMSGLIVQLPLPAHIDTKRVLDAVPASIDVDATSSETSEKFYTNNPTFVFPTAAAVVEIIDSLGINLSGKKVAMIGQGILVGKPVSHILKSRGVDLSVADNSTKNLPEILGGADIVISATGQVGLIKSHMLKKDVILIDAGTSESNGSIAGDVDQTGIESVVSMFSPVPGGVGPVTVAMLMQNVVISAERKNAI